MRKAFLVPILFTLFLLPTFAGAAEDDCDTQTLPVVNLMATAFAPKIQQIRDASVTYLVPGLIVIGIIAVFTDHLRGRMNYRAFLFRTLIVLLLLRNYTATDNFRDVIRNSANKVAVSLTGNSNRTEAMFESMYRMFRSVEGAGQSNIGNKAAATLILLLTPAGWIMILFFVTTILTAALSFVLDMGTSILLLALDVLGPLVLPFGILATTKDIAWGWIYRYVEVSFYKILYAIFTVAIATLYELLAQAFSLDALTRNDINTYGCMFTAIMISVAVAVISIFSLSKIPSLASGLVEGVAIGPTMNPTHEVGPERLLNGDYRKAKRFAV